MFRARLLMGQGFRQLEIYRSSGDVNSSGRAIKSVYQPTGLFLWGVLMDAKQQAVAQWTSKEVAQNKQTGHPMRCRIVQYGVFPAAKPGDCLVGAENDYHYVLGLKNPGELGLTNIYFTVRREDLPCF